MRRLLYLFRVQRLPARIQRRLPSLWTFNNNRRQASEGDPQYASKTIPNKLCIDQSFIPGGFAKSVIKKGVRFRPYQGACVLNEEEAHNSGYSWEVSFTLWLP